MQLQGHLYEIPGRHRRSSTTNSCKKFVYIQKAAFSYQERSRRWQKNGVVVRKQSILFILMHLGCPNAQFEMLFQSHHRKQRCTQEYIIYIQLRSLNGFKITSKMTEKCFLSSCTYIWCIRVILYSIGSKSNPSCY